MTGLAGPIASDENEFLERFHQGLVRYGRKRACQDLKTHDSRTNRVNRGFQLCERQHRKVGCPVKIDKSKYDSDGQLKKGLFKEQFKDGALSCIGEYINGEKTGEWKYYLRNGLLKAIGRYANGKMTGEWKWYRENGKLMQTGEFEEEKRVGLWKRYHANGALYDEGQYVNDKKVGEWRIYDSNGKLRKTTNHK